jgi:hypothetical protein
MCLSQHDRKMMIGHSSFHNGTFLLVVALLSSGQAPVQASCGERYKACAATALTGMTEMAQATVAPKAADSQIGGDAAAATGRSGVGEESSSAPACAIQHPSLLSKYRFRPPWRVAGVDYCVGNPSNITLKDPSTISMSGVSVDTAHHMITVTGNNVTLDGYDFSLSGGWGVSTRAANTSILNSKFVVGSNGNPPIHGTATASNLQVGYTSVDGEGVDLGTGLIEMKGSGLTVHYSAVMNSGGDLIQAHGSGIIDLQHNLIEQGGIAPGAHGDFLESIGGPFSATILYNTTFQHSGGVGGTQGLMLEPDFHQWPGVITSAEYAYNTFVATGGNQNYFLGVTVADIVNTVTVHDNYFTRGTYGFAPGGIRSGPNDGSNKTIFTNNVNMVSGAVLQDYRPPATTPQR